MAQDREMGELGTPDSKNQALLIQFLRNELGLSLTFLAIARNGLTESSEALMLIKKVEKALVTVRNLNGRVQDPALWQEIHNTANQLEYLLIKFQTDPLPACTIGTTSCRL